MKIIITIEDTKDGEIQVTEERAPTSGETEESVTPSTALVDTMFEVMDQLGERDWYPASVIRLETGLKRQIKTPALYLGCWGLILWRRGRPSNIATNYMI